MRIRILVPALTVALAALGVASACSAQNQETQAAEEKPQSVEGQVTSEASATAEKLGEAAQQGAAAQVVQGVDTRAEQAASAVEKRGAAGAAAEAAETVQENVEHSADVLHETYETKREKGESPVRAAGQAYDAVLDTAKSGEQTTAEQPTTSTPAEQPAQPTDADTQP